MEQPSPAQQGIVATLKRLVSTSLTVAQNRLELFLVEFREERLQFFELVLLAGIVLVLVAMTLAIITVAIVYLCLKNDRPGLLIGIIVAYLVITGVTFWRLRRRLKVWEPFSATLSELKKDKACFADKN